MVVAAVVFLQRPPSSQSQTTIEANDEKTETALEAAEEQTEPGFADSNATVAIDESEEIAGHYGLTETSHTAEASSATDRKLFKSLEAYGTAEYLTLRDLAAQEIPAAGKNRAVVRREIVRLDWAVIDALVAGKGEDSNTLTIPLIEGEPCRYVARKIKTVNLDSSGLTVISGSCVQFKGHDVVTILVRPERRWIKAHIGLPIGDYQIHSLDQQYAAIDQLSKPKLHD